MEMIITSILGIGIAVSPVVMILTESVKKTELIPSKFIPLASVAVGFLFGVALGVFFPDVGKIAETAIAGIVAGGMACGLYDATNKYSDENDGE